VYAVPLALTAVAAALAWALAALAKKLQAQATESKLAAVGARLALLADAVVRDVEATLKPELRAAVADGVLTQEELKKLKQAAFNRLKIILTERGMTEAAAVLAVAAPGLSFVLGGYIERAVAGLRQEKAVDAAALVRQVTAAGVGPTLPLVTK
jgi:hypothetical protein